MRTLDDSVPVSEEVLITPFTPAELEARIVRARRRLQPDPSRFSHFSPEVADSPLIAANPRASVYGGGCGYSHKHAGNRPLFAPTAKMADADRIQEVGGSNPPSSIARCPCTWASSLSQVLSNRREFALHFGHECPKSRQCEGITGDSAPLPASPKLRLPDELVGDHGLGRKPARRPVNSGSGVRWTCSVAVRTRRQATVRLSESRRS